MKSLFLSIGSLFLLVIFISCTGSTQKLADTSESSNSSVPGWFSSNGFSSDSLAFYGYGVAIAADSTDALERATQDAQNQLSFHLGKLAEDVRRQMEREKVSASSNADFILLLRNAHGSVDEFSETKNTFLLSPDDTYRALVQISISKQQAHQMFKVGFEGHPRYWAAFSGSPDYKSSIQD